MNENLHLIFDSQDLFLEENAIKRYLNEEIYMKDLAGATSNITGKYKDLRLNDPTLRDSIDVLEATWDSSDDLVIYFYVTPTQNTQTTKVMTPSGRSYPGSFYNVVFKFEGVSEILGDKETFKQSSDDAKKIAAIKNLIRVRPVKVYSNDPSFWWQGMYEDLEYYDGNIFPFQGPKGDGVWRKRHVDSGGLNKPPLRITKHMSQVISIFDDYVQTINAKLKVA